MSRAYKLLLAGVFLLSMLLFVPMRVGLNVAGVDRWGVGIREVRGSIWDGRLYDLMLGDVALGSVEASLSPVQLLMGRARFDIARQLGQPDDIAGAFTVGFGRIGIDDVTGNVPVGRLFAPVPLGNLAMEDVTAWFAGDRCGHAEGRVRAQVTGQLPGLSLAQGLSGNVACDGDAILMPLVSQSGMERITLRLMRSGRYVAEMRVDTADATLAETLAQSGFARSGDSLLLKVEGAL